MFKTVVLGIQYGLGPHSLAVRTGMSLFEAGEILARLRARFHVFEDYAQAVADHAGLDLELSHAARLGDAVPARHQPAHAAQFPDPVDRLPRSCTSPASWPSAATSRSSRRCTMRFMAEATLDRAERCSAALDRVMRDAAAVVLRGYELPTDKQIVRPGERYYEDRGVEMWDTVNRLLAKLEARSA